MGAIFVTGTGTDIGKTFLTAGLVQHLRATGRAIDAIKPVMSGYDPAQAAESDAGVLLRALGRTANDAEISKSTPWRFRAPLAPDLAAAREGRTLDVDALIAHCRDAAARAKGTLLIEGVGGVMVPLNGTRTVLDWIVALNVPLLLVTGSYLGSISHTLTALQVLEISNLDVLALIVNESENSTVPLDDTVATLTRLGKGVDVVTLPRGAKPDHPAFAQIAALLPR